MAQTAVSTQKRNGIGRFARDRPKAAATMAWEKMVGSVVP
jgi:hypothetical protein